MKSMKKLTLCIIMVCFTLFLIGAVSAARTIQNVTLNGASSVDVSAGENITANITVKMTADSDKWNSTKYKIGSSATSCIDTKDYAKKGNYSDLFFLTAPSNKGKYTFQVWVYTGKNCSGIAVSKSFPNVIKVISKCGDSIINGSEQCDDGNVNSGDGCSSSCLLETIYYHDSDADNYGNASDFLQALSAPEGYVADNTDCDDKNANVNPAAAELCNGIDDNCNAETDEGYNVGAGCYSNPNSCGDTSPGFYVCSEGGVICNAETPIAIDSDSDGTADCLDLCVSDPFKTEEGICGCGVAETDTDKDGTPDCIETDTNCDGIDNDGNGIADDGYAASETFCGTGACASTGLMQCVEGIEVDSCVEGTPSEEICNNIDDNCNGQVDEENGFEPLGYTSFSISGPLTKSCYTGPENTIGIGICASGLQTCSEGKWGSCINEVLPTEEICDGLDNNCDGATDEGNYSDSDSDGIKDCVDTDNDNDGIADSEDKINGGSSDLSTNVPGGLALYVNDTQDAASYAGVGRVKIANSSGCVIVEFDYDFSNALDLTSVNVTLGNESGFGSLIIRGINLSGQNVTKIAYIDRLAGTNTICIIDDEVDSIIVEGDCSNGIKLSCPGANGDYSCELADNRYKVSGLTHSAVAEYSYAAPAEEPHIGGSSGVLIVVPHNVPKPAEEAPIEEVPEEPAVEEPAVESPAEEAPEQVVVEPIKPKSRFEGITGRVINSIRNAPGKWGGAAGLVLAFILIIAIYIPTHKVFKQ